ncbi:hypothetical protein ACFY89_15970 [Achromobacter spanius]
MTVHILVTSSIDAICCVEQAGTAAKEKTPPLFKGGAKERWSGETDKRK